MQRATGVPVGTVPLKPLPDGAGEIEIGWHLHPDSWGRGFATETARALLARGWIGARDDQHPTIRPDGPALSTPYASLNSRHRRV